MIRVISIFLPLSLFVLVGCGGGGGGGGPVNPPIQPPEDQKAEWTIMVYMGGDNNLAPAAIGDIQELEQVGSTDKVHFTVLADVYYEQLGFAGEFEPVMLTDGNGNPVVPMMHISKHPEEGIQSHLTDTKAVLNSLDGFNSADPNTLTNFIKWSMQRFPAKHYALILWNHGSSWTPGRNLAAVISDNYDANGEAMNISEVENAIKNAGIHLDFLDFDACNMASIEVMYELKDVTDYICASQKAEPGTGNNYSVFASSLTANPTCSTEQLGKFSVDSYINFYAETGKLSVTRSLVKTDKLDNLALAINDLGVALTNPALTSNTELLNRLYEPIRFRQDVDLNNLLDVLTIYYPSISNTVANVKSALTDSVIYNRTLTGFQEYPNWSFGSREFAAGEDILVDGVGGINIYLPMQRDFKEDYVSLYAGMDFNFTSHWYDFIHYVYWGTPFGPTVPAGWWAGLVWDTNVDLDLWVFEPDGYGGVTPACPAFGPYSYNGYLSSDSFWTGDSFESYISKPEVMNGPYFFLATYSMPSLFDYDANCMLALGYSLEDMEPVCSDIHYISQFLPNDPDFGCGVVYFGFIIYNPNDGNWYYAWDDRSGDAVRQVQFVSIRNSMSSRSATSNQQKIEPPTRIGNETIELYHKLGLDLARKLGEKK